MWSPQPAHVVLPQAQGTGLHMAKLRTEYWSNSGCPVYRWRRTRRTTHQTSASPPTIANQGSRTPTMVTSELTVSTTEFQPLTSPPRNPPGATAPGLASCVKETSIVDRDTWSLSDRRCTTRASSSCCRELRADSASMTSLLDP